MSTKIQFDKILNFINFYRNTQIEAILIFSSHSLCVPIPLEIESTSWVASFKLHASKFEYLLSSWPNITIRKTFLRPYLAVIHSDTANRYGRSCHPPFFFNSKFNGILPSIKQHWAYLRLHCFQFGSVVNSCLHFPLYCCLRLAVIFDTRYYSVQNNSSIRICVSVKVVVWSWNRVWLLISYINELYHVYEIVWHSSVVKESTFGEHLHRTDCQRDATFQSDLHLMHHISNRW